MDPMGEKIVNGINRTAAWKGESSLTISKRCGMINMVGKKIIPRNTAFLLVDPVRLRTELNMVP
jgi:hypothetical protein